MNIVIVELPAKAKTVNKYLGPDYRVLASYGHVRDLPSKNGSVEPDKDFEMHWDVEPKAAKRLDEIAKAVKGADKLILATDPDREGEAISWHVLQVLDRKKALGRRFRSSAWSSTPSPKRPCSTPCAIRARSTGLWSTPISPAARWTISSASPSRPVLWRKLPGARSAGRVQSVALRLVCDRELEIEQFKAQEYWSILAELATAKNETFQARLVPPTARSSRSSTFPMQATADRLKAALEGGRFPVADCRKQVAAPQPGRALHHLDPAAGSIAQARLLAAPHHAARAAAL